LLVVFDHFNQTAMENFIVEYDEEEESMIATPDSAQISSDKPETLVSTLKTNFRKRKLGENQNMGKCLYTFKETILDSEILIFFSQIKFWGSRKSQIFYFNIIFCIQCLYIIEFICNTYTAILPDTYCIAQWYLSFLL